MLGCRFEQAHRVGAEHELGEKENTASTGEGRIINATGREQGETHCATSTFSIFRPCDFAMCTDCVRCPSTVGGMNIFELAILHLICSPGIVIDQSAMPSHYAELSCFAAESLSMAGNAYWAG